MKKHETENVGYNVLLTAVFGIAAIAFFVEGKPWGGVMFLAVFCVALFFQCRDFVEIAKARKAEEPKPDPELKAAKEEVNNLLRLNDYARLGEWLVTSRFFIPRLEDYFYDRLFYSYLQNKTVSLPELKKIKEADKFGTLFPYVCLAVERILPNEDKILECYLTLIDIWHEEPDLLSYFCILIGAIHDGSARRRQGLALALEIIVRQRLSHYRKTATIKKVGQVTCNRKIADCKKYFELFAQIVAADSVSYWLFTRPDDKKQAYVTYSLNKEFPIDIAVREPLRKGQGAGTATHDPEVIMSGPSRENNPYEIFTMPISRENYLKHLHQSTCKKFDRFTK